MAGVLRSAAWEVDLCHVNVMPPPPEMAPYLAIVV